MIRIPKSLGIPAASVVLALATTIGVGVLGASSADAAIKVCGSASPGVCGHIGGPGQL